MIELKLISSQDYDVLAKISRSFPKLSSDKRSRISGEDRISNLPQPLKHDILSKLPTKDAMQTMVLSKAWNDDWLTSPCLDLTKAKGDIYFADTQLRNLYLDYAFRVLTKRNYLNCLSIERLHQFLPSSPGTRRNRNGKKVDNLLCYAFTTFMIHELKLRSYSKPSPYELSKDIIQYAHSLAILELECLKLDQQTISILAVKCPFLKSLELRFCDLIDKKIRVSGLHKLVNMSVKCKIPTLTAKGGDVNVMIIDAPSPVKFRYFGVSNYYKVSPTHVISDSSCKGLKHLELINILFYQSSLNRVLLRLPNLQHLKLSCRVLCYQRLDICSPSLKHLELRLLGFVEQLHIDAPKLTDFVYAFSACDGHPIIIPFNADSFNPEKVTIDIVNFSTTRRLTYHVSEDCILLDSNTWC